MCLGSGKGGWVWEVVVHNRMGGHAPPSRLFLFLFLKMAMKHLSNNALQIQGRGENDISLHIGDSLGKLAVQALVPNHL